MDALKKLVLRISLVYGEGSLQHGEALAVFRSTDASISRTQAVVYLCDILDHGSLSREVLHPTGDAPRSHFLRAGMAPAQSEGAR